MALWTYRNIKAWIYLNDHCDPHVTFECRADDWRARMSFSMVKPHIGLVDIKPRRNAPSLALLNELANQVDVRLDQCRMAWWRTQGGELCIDNKGAERAGPGRVVLDGLAPTGTIIARSGRYVPNADGSGHHVRASVLWADDSVTVGEILE